jgi:hypothetical protein
MSYMNQRRVEEHLREVYEAGERARQVAGTRPKREARSQFIRRRSWHRLRRLLATVVQ